MVFIDNTNLHKYVKCFFSVKEMSSHVSVQECDITFTSILFHFPAGCIKPILSINHMVDFLCTDKIVIDTSMDKIL